MVKRALQKAGDLAHGLKTPLAVLAQEAERAADSGHAEVAAIVSQQVERMRRQIEYQLVQARAASGAVATNRSSVLDSAEGLRRTLLRLHAERGLTIDLEIPAKLAVQCRREDLDEMLGNLLDNACKWARSRVVVAAAQDEAWVTICVDDDGPGLAPPMRRLMLDRGVRADEASPGYGLAGSGLGLAIVREIAEMHGGSIARESSPMGGLRAEMRMR